VSNSTPFCLAFDGFILYAADLLQFIIQLRSATSSSFRGRAIFIKFHSMTSSYLSNRVTTFSQTVTHVIIFCPHSIQTHTFCTTLVNKNRTFHNSVGAESPVSSEISDLTPYAHAQNNILHAKYAEKTDD